MVKMAPKEMQTIKKRTLLQKRGPRKTCDSQKASLWEGGGRGLQVLGVKVN